MNVEDMTSDALRDERDRLAWRCTCIIAAAPNLAALDTFDTDRLREASARAEECQRELERRYTDAA